MNSSKRRPRTARQPLRFTQTKVPKTLPAAKSDVGDDVGQGRWMANAARSPALARQHRRSLGFRETFPAPAPMAMQRHLPHRNTLSFPLSRLERPLRIPTPFQPLCLVYQSWRPPALTSKATNVCPTTLRHGVRTEHLLLLSVGTATLSHHRSDDRARRSCARTLFDCTRCLRTIVLAPGGRALTTWLKSRAMTRKARR